MDAMSTVPEPYESDSSSSEEEEEETLYTMVKSVANMLSPRSFMQSLTPRSKKEYTDAGASNNRKSAQRKKREDRFEEEAQKNTSSDKNRNPSAWSSTGRSSVDNGTFANTTMETDFDVE